MAIIRCKMCGGDLHLVEGASTAVCEFCGSMQTVPQADDEKKLTLFGRANRLRAACEFDKAAGIYESIVADFPEEAEAYWGLVLCKYGIEYVDDPATGKKIPTCHRSSFDSIMEDSDFEQVLEKADSVARKVYREEAKTIEEIRKGIVAVSNNEEPYDIFICYKETAENGERTLDSVLAQDVYDHLTDKGYRVFFSRVTLEDKLGMEYEPYIFAALNSAKIMLAFGTDYEYFNAVWVKNEWSRYLKLMAQDKSKHLIPCYKGIDAYDMPKEFVKLQAQDLGKVGAVQDLLRGIAKIIPRKQAQTAAASQPAAAVSPVEAYLKRAQMALEDGEWDNANAFCEQALNIDPENARAYLIKLLAEMHVLQTENLSSALEFAPDNKNFKKALRFADESLKKKLAKCVEDVEKKVPERELAAKRKAEEEDLKKNATVVNGVLTRYQCADSNVNIPYGVTSLGEELFYEDDSIISVTIPDTVTSIGKGAFYLCTELTSVTIPNSVISIGEVAFQECNSLTTVTIPENVVNIGADAFCSCENLTSINIPANVIELDGNPFSSCPRLQSIVVAEANEVFCVMNGHLVNKKTKTLVCGCGNAPIPDDGSVTNIGNSAFSDLEYLTAVTIPECVTNIDAHAFSGCEALRSVNISSGVTSIGNDAFSYCKNLRSITIPGSVIGIGFAAFQGCEELTSVTILNGVTSISNTAFANCKALTSVTIPSSVTEIGDRAFAKCGRVKIFTSMGSYAWTRATGYGYGMLGDEQLEAQEDEQSKQVRLASESKQREKYRASGRCQHCGGELKGFFSKKCASCGKAKDY